MLSSSLQGQGLRIGGFYAPEASTAIFANQALKPEELLQRGHITQTYGLQVRAEIMPFLGIETGFYFKERCSREPKLPAQPGPVHSFHFQYLSFPLRLRLNWEELFFSIGPSLEILQQAYQIQNGQRREAERRMLPSRSIEMGLGFQMGWENRLAAGFNAFAALQIDAQWLRPLRPDEPRHLSMGLVIGVNWGK